MFTIYSTHYILVLCANILTVQAATIVTTPATYLVKSSNLQAISKIDWLSTLSGDKYAYLACSPFEDPQIQISLAISTISIQ